MPSLGRLAAASAGAALLLSNALAAPVHAPPTFDPPGSARPPRLAYLPVPGPASFVVIARDVLDIAFSLDPSLASGAGMHEDAIRAPSFSAASVAALTKRLDRDLSAMRKESWRRWPIDTQMDFRWIFATAENLRNQLNVEKLYTHRPASWLEPYANNLIALASYAPERPELQDRVLALAPAMLAEMQVIAAAPTAEDVDTGRDLALALARMAAARNAEPARSAFTAYASFLTTQATVAPFSVVGAQDYAWRYRHTLLLPWTPTELLAQANVALTTLDARMAGLPPGSAPQATAEQNTAAEALNGHSLLALYDSIEEAHRAATVRGGWVTIPDAVGPIHARETPEAMIPLTGDGGSMNPPPTWSASNVGYWNVEHFRADMSPADRLDTVVSAQNFLNNGMGPYAAHEGFPGHHLQLAIARLNPDPLRSILPDPAQNEGWGLYAEEVFWEHGGLGNSPDSERAYLRSYRARIMRVFYDVHIESGEWTLQQAADFKHDTPAGESKVDEDILRSINWPTQLICYFSGKTQIIALREAYKQKLGNTYTDRGFHDAFLAEGSIPIALIRAKLLGEPIPDLPRE